MPFTHDNDEGIEDLHSTIAELRNEIAASLDTIRDAAAYKVEVMRLTVILDAIIAQTEPRDGGLYVRSAGAWRRLPDGMTEAIVQAKRYLGLVA